MASPLDDIIGLIKQRGERLEFEKDWPDYRLAAICLHGKQEYGSMPYAYHLAQVEAILADAGFSSYEYQAAAWLHDCIEDTEADFQMIYDGYGGTVAKLVYGCTGEGLTRKERNATIYKRLNETPAAAIIKVADRIANVRSGMGIIDFNIEKTPIKLSSDLDKLKMYLDEWPEFKENVQKHVINSVGGRTLWSALENDIEKGKRLFKGKNVIDRLRKLAKEKKGAAQKEPPQEG